MQSLFRCAGERDEGDIARHEKLLEEERAKQRAALLSIAQEVAQQARLKCAAERGWPGCFWYPDSVVERFSDCEGA